MESLKSMVLSHCISLCWFALYSSLLEVLFVKMDIAAADKTLPEGWWVDPAMSFLLGYYYIRGDVHVYDNLFVRVSLYWDKGTLFARITLYSFNEDQSKEWHEINRVLRLKNQKRRSVVTMRNAITTFQDKHWLNMLYGKE